MSEASTVASEDLQRANESARSAWNQNAAFWDERMGGGNEFVEVLIWPATERLLALRPGERVLDIACGNGLSSRRLAAMGGKVFGSRRREKDEEHEARRTRRGSLQGTLSSRLRASCSSRAFVSS